MRRGRTAVPRAAWIVAVVAVLHGLAWGLLVPVFQVPDEPQHVAYAQYLAETGRAPGAHATGTVLSPEEGAAFIALRAEQVIGHAATTPPLGDIERRGLRPTLAGERGRRSDGASSPATNNPPLYYALEAGPYWAATAAGGDFLDRVQAMRLLGALMMGATALFAYLFVRELLPATPWAATAGGLAVALQPLLGFIAGGVNNDNLLFASGAALFWWLARTWRRGLDLRSGLVLGAIIAVALLSKLTAIGLLPGVAIALVAMWLRAPAPRRAAALRGAAAAIAVAALPVLAYALVSTLVWDRPLYGSGGANISVVAQGAGGPARAFDLRELLSYTWQFYLPRLPSMTPVPGQDFYPLSSVWIDGFIGRFGWLDYGFPTWADAVGTVLLGAILIAAVLGVARGGGLRGGRAAELSIYVAMVAGLLGLIAVAGYTYRLSTPVPFEQARYLLVLLPLYAALVALAARAAGRFGPALAGVLVVLAAGHAVFAQMLTVARYLT